MLLSRIPVRVVATNPFEYQALADVLASGQAGALELAANGEGAIVAVICPSGDAVEAAGLPALHLGGKREDGGEGIMRVMAVPATLSDIFTALEALAQKSVDFAGPRDHGGWHLDPARLTVRAPDGHQVTLTDTETRLLVILFDANGQELDKDELLQRVWGYRPGLDTHTLETHIYRLRQKIETNPTSPVFLMTTDQGYRLA